MIPLRKFLALMGSRRNAGRVRLRDGTCYTRVRLGNPRKLPNGRVVWRATWFRDPPKPPSKRDAHRAEVRERRVLR